MQKIVFISDLHYSPMKHINKETGIERKLTQEAVPLLNKLIEDINNSIKPDLVICLGDLIQDLKNHDNDLENFKYIWHLLGSIKAPFYSCLGNHDLKNMSSREELEKIMGYNHSTFSFDINGLHVIILGTYIDKEKGLEEGGIYKSQFISKEDLLWLEKDLKTNQLPAILCVHYGVAEDTMKDNWWFEKNPETALLGNRKELKEILKKDSNVLAVFSGHQHWTKKLIEDGISYYVLGSLIENIKNDGIPDGVYFVVNINNRQLDVIEEHVKLDILK